MSRNSLTFQDIFHFSISLTLETLHSYHFFTSHLLFLSLTLFTCAYYSPFFSISKVCSNIRHGPKRLVTSKKPKTAEVESSRVQEPFDRIKFLGLEQQDRQSVERNSSGVAIRLHMEDLLREAQVLLVLILHNIRPSSHTSAFTLDTPQLLYLIMLGRRIDVAQIIANEMRNVVESGKEFGAGTKTICPLVFPGLMMGLLIASRVQIPNMVHFKIKTKVNDMYVDKYCLEKKRREGQSGQTSSETLNYNDWDLRLRQDFTYTWDQNDSSHRVVMSLHDAIYKLKILPEV